MRRWCYPAVALTIAVFSCVAAASAVAAYGVKRPKIAKHADVRAEATSASGAVVHYAPARVRGATSIKYSKRSGSVFPLGTTRVTITARNRAGSSKRERSIGSDRKRLPVACSRDGPVRRAGRAGSVAQVDDLPAVAGHVEADREPLRRRPGPVAGLRR